MPEAAFSIAEAKARFAEVVGQAEQGSPVRITRRGKPVVVMLSEQEYAKLLQPQGGWFSFGQQWRQAMQAQGLDFLSDEELSGLRNATGRPELDLA